MPARAISAQLKSEPGTEPMMTLVLCDFEGPGCPVNELDDMGYVEVALSRYSNISKKPHRV